MFGPSTRPRLLALTLASLAAGALGGCDAQASPDYQGEALLTLRGSVEISDEQSAQLIPVLAFLVPTGLEVVDAEVQGEFPSSFTLDVFEPPPSTAFTSQLSYPGEPDVAVGYIAAAHADHAAHYPLASSRGESSGSCSPQGCTFEKEWCTLDDAQCYREVLLCPDSAADPESCELQSSEGDVALKTGPWASFGGFSENYIIAYLPEAAPRHSVVAHQLGANDGLTAGYHLFAIDEIDKDDAAAGEGDGPSADLCHSDAVRRATELYNAEHGTSYDDAYGAYEQCAADDFACQDTVDEEVSWLVRKAEAELECPPDNVRITPIEHPENTPISVRISPEARPFGRN